MLRLLHDCRRLQACMCCQLIRSHGICFRSVPNWICLRSEARLIVAGLGMPGETSSVVMACNKQKKKELDCTLWFGMA